MAQVLWSPEAVARVGTVAETRWAPGGAHLAWVRGTAAVAALAVDGAAVPDLEPVGTRGTGFAWLDADHLLVVGADGLRRLRCDERGPGRLVVPTAGRAAVPAVCGRAGLVAFVDETDEACRVMVAPLDGSRAPWPVSHADFAVDPAWSGDGRLLAWHEWDESGMPWDGSRIVVMSLADGHRTVVAGGPDESVGQPRFAPGPGPARLGCVRDRDGWANVVVLGADGHSGAALAESAEHAEPTWGPGQRSYAWSPEGERIAWCRNEDGFGRLVVAPAPAPGGAAWAPVEWSKGWHHGLDWGPAGLACTRSGARTPPSVVVFSGTEAQRRLVETAAGVDVDAVAGFVEPRPVTWTADDGAVVHGLWFTPPQVAQPAPLLVYLHGGPTDQARVEWSPRLQFWVQRGWAVLAPNPRGSTGYGRAYTQALAGAWGERDVADVIAGIRAARARAWGDGSPVAIVGGSAGGYAALLVAVGAPDLVRAVVASYPVTDLVALAQETHRFERHYTDALVGPRPGAAAAWRDRSPRTHAGALRVPVLVLQGDADPVVSLAQSVAFVDAVRAGGGDARLHVYPGEGHGWKQPATVADALRRSEAFLGRPAADTPAAPAPGGSR